MATATKQRLETHPVQEQMWVLGITQREVAQRLDVNPQSLANIFRGRVPMSERVLATP